MTPRKRIALIAHDARKMDLLEWADKNRDILSRHDLCGTGTTGGLIAEKCGLDVRRYKSGPLGGDQQIGALIADMGLDIMIFFWDPMAAQPHDVDVKALLRMSVLYNVAVACNRASADFLISSPLMTANYNAEIKDYSRYIPKPL
ncbi:methylglyoxal synthase [Desulfatiferula olefinivorans]